MKAIVLVDTSIFCEILGIPKKSAAHTAVLAELERRVLDDEWMLLPLATILETGNHVAQNGDGNLRRVMATRFVEQVTAALAGRSPFQPTAPLELDDLQQWLAEFPDYAIREIGLGDVSIIKEWERQRSLHPMRRVLIWSLDSDLFGYDTGPR